MGEKEMINIIGDFFGSSGYANHTRGLANALAKQTQVRLSTGLPNGWETQVTDRELLMVKAKPEKDEIRLIITMPHQWNLFKGLGRNWAYLIWEGDKVPESFIEYFLDDDIEYILVPSLHTKKAITNTNDNYEIVKKIKIISHGVDLDKFYPKDKPEMFRFVANKGFRNMEDRGGIQYLLQAYLEEFSINDKVELFLKINPVYGVANIEDIIRKLSPHKGQDGPVIRINASNLPYNKLVDIYNQGHVFVSPTRSDAFNIPCLEAMACGLPVITSSFGGQTDFVNEENGWIIDGELKEVTHECMYEGIKWLTPDISDLRNRMRVAFENKKVTEKKSIQALEDSKALTWDNSAKKLLELV